MIDARARRRLTADVVVESVRACLAGHDDLLDGFKAFLPEVRSNRDSRLARLARRDRGRVVTPTRFARVRTRGLTRDGRRSRAQGYAGEEARGAPRGGARGASASASASAGGRRIKEEVRARRVRHRVAFARRSRATSTAIIARGASANAKRRRRRRFRVGGGYSWVMNRRFVDRVRPTEFRFGSDGPGRDGDGDGDGDARARRGG